MKIEINGNEIQVNENETLLDAIKKLGINVPTLCYIKDLFPSGACRMCVVEVEGQRGLVPSCSAMPYEGMKVKTHSSRVLTARKTILELLLASHPDDCLYCDRNGSCELRHLSEELGVRTRDYKNDIKRGELDKSSDSLIRDPSKCILCGRCVRVCEEVQGVSSIDFTGRGSKAKVSPAFGDGLNMSTCINCGQCVMCCPTGALTEKSSIKEVIAALNDPDKFVVVQHAPAVSVTLGEYFGFKSGVDVCGVMTAAMRKIGFDLVFDTSFSADLTIMEEASELVERVKTGGVLPMMTSCSPGWIKFVEEFYPEMIPNLSTCKSPQQMLGALIKSYLPQKIGVDRKKIVSVSIMPCTAKKFEAKRSEMTNDGIFDVDIVLTTREFAKLLKMMNIDINNITPEATDNPLGERTSAGKIFGVTGGVTEAALRTAAYFITGKESREMIEFKEVRDLQGIKEATYQIGDLKLNIAVAHGLSNARKVLEDMKMGRKQYHFIEVMTCPGGCIGGGGQPFGIDEEKLISRMKALYMIDSKSTVRFSHRNESIMKLYSEFLEKPLSHKSHELLHTHYKSRKGASR